MIPLRRHTRSFLHCTPRRSIFVAVVGTSVVWMMVVVYFLNLERNDGLSGNLQQQRQQQHQQEPDSVQVDPNKMSDEELRELHRRGQLITDSVDQAMFRVRKQALEEIQKRRIALHGHLSEDELRRLGQKERLQERELFRSRLQQGENELLLRQQRGDHNKHLDDLHRREMALMQRSQRRGGMDMQGGMVPVDVVQQQHQPAAPAAGGGGGGEEDEQVEHGQLESRDNAVQSNEEETDSNVERSREESQEAVVVENNPNMNNQVNNAVADPQGKDAQAEQEKSAGYARHAFNQQGSDRIGDFRSIPDSRHLLCQSEKYPESLPKASIIICFHNEALSALRRTVKTAIQRGGGDKHILEVILVNDASTMSELQKPLQANMASISTLVRVEHLSDRNGLIRGRVHGANVAKGKVIVFLDSHCEANENWLLPLIHRIHEDKRHVVCPVIDIINLDTLEYQASPLVRGGFTWALNFNWESIPFSGGREHEMIEPARSPTMAGGLFAIDRSYFFEIGAYDKGMDIWGGENLEISFRLWMCGGTLEIIPCSRVGHIFRQRRPYDDAAGISAMSKNSVRVAEVWMDQFKQLYYEQRQFGSDNPGDVSERAALRKQLKCKSFQWYLQNVYPEKIATLPEKFKSHLAQEKSKEAMRKLPSDVKFHGQIRSGKMDMCVSVVQAASVEDVRLILAVCIEALSTDSDKKSLQTWSLSSNGALSVRPSTDQHYCLAANVESEKLHLAQCRDGSEDQSWQYFEKKQFVYSRALRKCLRLDMDTESVNMAECERTIAAQKWEFPARRST